MCVSLFKWEWDMRCAYVDETNVRMRMDVCVCVCGRERERMGVRVLARRVGGKSWTRIRFHFRALFGNLPKFASRLGSRISPPP